RNAARAGRFFGGTDMSDIDPARGIDELRQEIDAIDEQIVRLLAQRAQVAARIGEKKRELGIPVQNVARENVVLERAKSLNRGPAGDRAVEAVYRSIIDMCLEVQARSSEKRHDRR
ncbi:MAG: chorismate mutase, partial [Verrucomicrobiota bacterium]|nr:chorismate mutase [Verrucomicrobiota bacterium]